MKFYILDNHDSFVYNLAAYVQMHGADVVVETIDSADIATIDQHPYSGIIISPGPGTPGQAVCSRQLVGRYGGKIPILGVCLGHQVIGYCYGANVCKGRRPMHGKLSVIKNNGKGLFCNLPEEFYVTRYHSLIIEQDSLPVDFRVDAVTAEGEIMAISHEKAPIYGLQFHPEALLTEFGFEMLGNFIEICISWEKSNDKY